MSFPNLSGLSLHATAPTQEFYTLKEGEAKTLNQGEEGRDDGEVAVRMVPFEEGKVYFRVRKPEPGGGAARNKLFDYDYFVPSDLWEWSRTNRQNPMNRQPLSAADYAELRDRLTKKRGRGDSEESADAEVLAVFTERVYYNRLARLASKHECFASLYDSNPAVADRDGFICHLSVSTSEMPTAEALNAMSERDRSWEYAKPLECSFLVQEGSVAGDALVAIQESGDVAAMGAYIRRSEHDDGSTVYTWEGWTSAKFTVRVGHDRNVMAGRAAAQLGQLPMAQRFRMAPVVEVAFEIPNGRWMEPRLFRMLARACPLEFGAALRALTEKCAVAGRDDGPLPFFTDHFDRMWDNFKKTLRLEGKADLVHSMPGVDFMSSHYQI